MDLNSIVFFNPDYHLRNDINRIIMYSASNVAPYSSAEWVGYIHPAQAAIFMIFMEKRTLRENINLLCQHFNLPFEKVIQLITPYICNESPFYTEYQSQRILFPKSVLIYSGCMNGIPHYSTFTKHELHCNNIDLTPDRVRLAPLSMTLMLTTKCSTSCKYCYADRKTPHEELSTSQIISIIKEAHTLRMEYINIIGGDIFCRKDWGIILKELANNNLSPQYISTKKAISLKDVQTLYETGYKGLVQISLDSLNEMPLKQTIRCSTNYVERIKESIHYLQQYNFNLCIDTILTRYSTQEDIQALYEYLKTVKRLNHWEIRIPEKSIYTPSSFAEIKADRKALMDLCNFIEETIIPKVSFPTYITKTALERKYRQGRETDACFDGGKCGILCHRCFILPDGKVTPCEQLYWHPQFIVGDLKKESLKEIWQSPRAKSIFSMGKEQYRNKSRCKSCNNVDTCSSNHRKCWIRVIRAYGEENWDFPDPECCYAPPIPNESLYE